MLKRRGRAWSLIKKDFFVLNAAAFFPPGAAVPRKAATFFKARPVQPRACGPPLTGKIFIFFSSQTNGFFYSYTKRWCGERQAIKLCIGWILQRSFWEKAVLPLRPVVY
jgi:hypothetical protein